MSGSGARPLATVKLEGACARPASWSRLVTWKGAETAVQRRALRLPPSCPPAPTRDGGQPPGKREGRGCCQVLSSDWLSGNLRQLRGKDYLASRMRNSKNSFSPKSYPCMEDLKGGITSILQIWKHGQSCTVLRAPRHEYLGSVPFSCPTDQSVPGALGTPALREAAAPVPRNDGHSSAGGRQEGLPDAALPERA
ncbi:mitochondrial translation release factor in rescue isoform X2 [Ovis aries]|uniref:mitochondrial translation release factor in rescue isoform X2 n=1 Tax=Ovis aries TaxID=9940 RepID=UPI0029527DFA|nr:mitochondrial translation release factor in rescue isoform X2 [Ovis aries]